MSAHDPAGSLMKLNQLRALAAVAETGSIQEASRILHLALAQEYLRA